MKHSLRLGKKTKIWAIAFHTWMVKNDTSENAEKWFHFSDEDMFDAFKKEMEDNH